MVAQKPFAELTAGLSEKEIDAVKAGKLVVGMSKAAVIMARGYPPEHRTPSTEVNNWLYWENRFRKKAVNFDSEGRTTKRAVPDDEL